MGTISRFISMLTFINIHASQLVLLTSKYAPSVNAFKAGLEYLKSYNPDSRHRYWYLSQEIFNRIPDKDDHVTYLESHPEVAMRRHISCF